MNNPRENIMQSLFDKITKIDLPDNLKFAAQSRRFRMWDDVQTQPALFLKQEPSTASQEVYGLTRWTMRASIWIYWRAEGSQDPSIPLDRVVNLYMDALEFVLQGSFKGDAQTLDGLVSHCYIDGDVAFDDGSLDGQGVLPVPISILIGV